MARRRIGLVRSILQAILSPVATSLAGFVGSGYNATDPRRKVIDRNQMFANKASANQLLNGSLSQLRTYCRHLERNNPTAKAGILALQGLIVGTGIDLEPDTGDETTNKRVRDLFYDWLMRVCVDGRDIYQLQTLAVHELPTAGEWLWRIVPAKASDDGPIPLRVLPLEGEWLDEVRASAPENGCTLSAGIELDRYGCPVAYYLSPPEMGKAERVAAGSIVHGFEQLRPLQSRGEPWLAPVIETLMNERDLVDAELKAAVITANLGIAVESDSHPATEDDDGDSADPVQSLGLGNIVRLYPGEKVHAFSHTRPSQMIAPFRQMLRGDIAAALRIPQRFLDRDVSRANYSSMRADMLDTQRLLAPVREWVGHKTIGRLYEIAAPFLSAMVGVAIDATKYRLLPDGQPYVDPVKDVAAASAAISAGLSTHEEQISSRGGNYRQIWAQLAKEQALREQLGVNMQIGTAPSQPQQSESKPEDDDDDEDDAKSEDESDDQPQVDDEESAARSHVRAIEIARASAPQSSFHIAPVIHVPPATVPTVEVRNEIPQQAAPVVNVQPPSVTVEAPHVTVEAARMEAPQVTVNVPQQAAPTVINQVSPTPVTVENNVEVQQRPVLAKPQRDGSVLMTPQE